MTFWIAAVAIPLVAALFLAWPMLNKGKSWLGFGLAILVLIPVGTLYLYQEVGTPEGLEIQADPHRGMAGNDANAGDMNEMLGQLRARLDNNPGDLEGWLLLGRSYKAVQQFDQAEEALRTAQRLAPEEPLVQVELAEALIFTSQGQTTDEIRGLLASALATNPDQQKGLWLSGMIASQAGDDALAVRHWQRLMNSLEPGTPVADSVQEQLNAANSRLGAPLTAPPGMALQQPPAGSDPIPNLGAPVRPAMPGTAMPAAGEAPATGAAGGGEWSGLIANITAPEGLGQLPGSATLFLIARDPAAPNPPLGAMRIPNPIFPISLQLTDANSMMPQRPISGLEQIEVSARLSMSGNVIPSGSDPRSQPQLVNPHSETSINLQLALP